MVTLSTGAFVALCAMLVINTIAMAYFGWHWCRYHEKRRTGPGAAR